MKLLTLYTEQKTAIHITCDTVSYEYCKAGLDISEKSDTALELRAFLKRWEFSNVICGEFDIHTQEGLINLLRVIINHFDFCTSVNEHMKLLLEALAKLNDPISDETLATLVNEFYISQSDYCKQVKENSIEKVTDSSAIAMRLLGSIEDNDNV